MKKIIALIICSILLIAIVPTETFKVSAAMILYWENDTESISPDGNTYHVKTSEQLAWVMMEVNGNANGFSGKTIVLDNDIDLNSDSRWWMPIGCYGNRDMSNVDVDMVSTTFKGTFDGQGHSVTGININNGNTFWKKTWDFYNGTVNLGLFGIVDGAIIKNVNVQTHIYDSQAGEEGHSGSNYNAGSLVGIASNNSVIRNCSGVLNAETNCETTNDSESLSVIFGGLIGKTYSEVGDSPVIENCFGSVSVKVEKNGNDCKGPVTTTVGGFCGLDSSNQTRIENCYGVIKSTDMPAISGNEKRNYGLFIGHISRIYTSSNDLFPSLYYDYATLYGDVRTFARSFTPNIVLKGLGVIGSDKKTLNAVGYQYPGEEYKLTEIYNGCKELLPALNSWVYQNNAEGKYYYWHMSDSVNDDLPYLNAVQPIEVDSAIAVVKCEITDGNIVSPSSKKLSANANFSQSVTLKYTVNMPGFKVLMRNLSTYGVLNFSKELPIGTVIKTTLENSPDSNTSYNYPYTYTVTGNPKSQIDLVDDIPCVPDGFAIDDAQLSFTVTYPANSPQSENQITASLQMGGIYNAIRSLITSKDLTYSFVEPINPSLSENTFVFNKTTESSDYKDVEIPKSNGTYEFDALYEGTTRIESSSYVNVIDDKIELSKNYLSSLSNGLHTFTLKYKETSVSPTFTIDIRQSPTIGTLTPQTVNALSTFEGLTAPSYSLNDSILKSSGWEYSSDPSTKPWQAFNDADIIEYSKNGGYVRYYVETAAGKSYSNEVTLIVNKLPLTVTVNDVIINRGQSIPTPQVTVFGFSNNVVPDGFVKPSAEVVGTIDTTDTSVTTYSVALSGGNATDNYTFNTFPTFGNITINKVNIADSDWSSDKNLDNWQNVNIVLRPLNGFSQISSDGINWSDSLTLSEEGENNISFCLKKSDGTLTEMKQIPYKIDKTAPDIDITVKENNWKTFLNKITFGIFFKESQDVVINSEDSMSGINLLYYFVSDKELSEDDVRNHTDWNLYQEKFNISDNGEYAVYVKAVDKVGNISYISSGGMVFDNVLPEITGIEDGKSYYDSLTFKVSDTYIDKVTLDGNEISLSNGEYTINADNFEHTILATDKAGNITKRTFKVLINENLNETGDQSHPSLFIIIIVLAVIGSLLSILLLNHKKHQQ